MYASENLNKLVLIGWKVWCGFWFGFPERCDYEIPFSQTYKHHRLGRTKTIGFSEWTKG